MIYVYLCSNLTGPEQNYLLSTVTELSEERQLCISAKIVGKLRGNLATPPDNYLMPVVAGYVSMITRLRYGYTFPI
jgi:hypothetical protein